MASNAMDMALDEIVSANRPKTGRRRSTRGGARVQVLGNTGPSPAARARVANTVQAKPAAATPATAAPSDKIIVSNLPLDVNESQVKELFHTTVGPLREVTIHYDSNGRSKGIAAVHFNRKGDGNKAYEQYNNRLIDGKRPMKIEIIVDPSRTPQSLVARVAPAGVKPLSQATGARPRRGRGGARGGKPRSRPAPKTAADLDAEMADYTASSAGAATTTA